MDFFVASGAPGRDIRRGEAVCAESVASGEGLFRMRQIWHEKQHIDNIDTYRIYT